MYHVLTVFSITVQRVGDHRNDTKTTLRHRVKFVVTAAFAPTYYGLPTRRNFASSPKMPTGIPEPLGKKHKKRQENIGTSLITPLGRSNDKSGSQRGCLEKYPRRRQIGGSSAREIMLLPDISIRAWGGPCPTCGVQ